MGKNACLLPSASVVRKAAQLFNISAKDAARLINKVSTLDDVVCLATQNGNDDNLLDTLKNSLIFQDELSRYSNTVTPGPVKAQTPEYYQKDILEELNKLRSFKSLKGLGSLKNIKEKLKNVVDPSIANVIVKAIEIDSSLVNLDPYSIFQKVSQTREDTIAKDYNENIQKEVDKELEDYLVSYLKRYNIEYDDFSDFAKEHGVAGVYDILGKIIHVANEEDRNYMTVPEEFAHAFVELMGSVAKKNTEKHPENKDYTYLYQNIENTSIYKQVYDQYKTIYVDEFGQPDEYKIKKEAIGQALATAITNKWENKNDNEATFWQRLKAWFEEILRKFKGCEYLNFNSLIDKIATEVINNDHSRLQKINSDNYRLLDYSETLANQNKKDGGKALDFMKFYTELGNIITGSLSYRYQGTVYRGKLDSLHDIDMIVPESAHHIDFNTIEYRAIRASAHRNTGALVNALEKEEYFQKIKEKYPKVKFLASYENGKGDKAFITVNAIYSEDENLSNKFASLAGSYAERLEHFTEAEREQMYLFDFFLKPQGVETSYVEDAVNGLRLASFDTSFKEKQFSMGRAKDIYDYQMWKLYDQFRDSYTPSDEYLMYQKSSHTNIKGDNLSSKSDSEFARSLTNPGNTITVEYKGNTFRNAEHAYQTWKSGTFDEAAYKSKDFKPKGSKPADKNTNFQTMVDILTAKLQQHTELISGITERGGIEYLKASTHNVVGDPYWESSGQNKFIEALIEAYTKVTTTPSQKSEEQLRREAHIAAIRERNRVAEEGKQLLSELYPDIDKTEFDDMADLAEKMATAISNSKAIRAQITQLTSQFKDPRHIEFLGDWIARRFCSIITSCMTSTAVAEKFSLPNYATRQDVYKDPKAVRLAIKGVRSNLLAQAKSIEGTQPELAKELRAAEENFPTLLSLYGNSLMRVDGVHINFNGAVVVEDSDASSAARNDSDANTEQDDDNYNAEITPVDAFSVSMQDMSVTSKIAPSIKALLSTIQEEGTIDEWGYGLTPFLNVSSAVNDLLFSLEGCTTFSEMQARLDIKAQNTPWVNTLNSYLDTNIDSNNFTAHAKEQLQSSFYRSFRKTFTPFRSTYTTTNKAGEIVFKNKDLNAPSIANRIMEEVLTGFADMSGIDIIEKGKIDPTLVGTVLNTANRNIKFLVQDIQDGAISSMKDCLEAESRLYDIISALGIKVPKEVYNKYFENGQIDNFEELPELPQDVLTHLTQLATLSRLTNSVLQMFFDRDYAIRKKLTTDTRESNPFSKTSDFKGKGALYVAYKNLVTNLAKFGARDEESMAYENHKSHYAWNNPSDVQTIIDHLKTKDINKFKEYVASRYQQDIDWFMVPGEEGRFYADWLESIINGNGRDVLEYSEKLSTANKTYEKQSDLLYRFSLLADYFIDTDAAHSTAIYRMPIFADKPRYGAMRFFRYGHGTPIADIAGNYAANDYHSIIANKATMFFAQELRRAYNVVQAATKDIVKYKHYDIEESDTNKAVLQKIKEGKKISIDDVVVNGKYIFEGTGASFHFSKFLNKEIADKTALGSRIVDIIFNTKGNDFKKQKGIKFLMESDISAYKKAFHKAMKANTDEFFENFRADGAFKVVSRQEELLEDGKPSGEFRNIKHAQYIVGNIKEWHSGEEGFTINTEANAAIAQQLAEQFGEQDAVKNGTYTYYMELAQFKSDLEEYTYNNWLAKANMIEMFSVDPAFYGGTTNFQKRNAQNISAGYPLNTEATFNGQRVSDGIHRFITITSPGATSSSITNIETALRSRVRELNQTNRKAAKQLERSIPTVLKKLKGFDSTDGQAYTNLIALRKHRIETGDWTYSKNDADDDVETTMTDEAVFRRFKNGNVQPADFTYVFAQIQKPFMFGFSSTPRGTADRKTITVPMQNKNSEYALSYIAAFTRAQRMKAQRENGASMDNILKNEDMSVLEAIQQVMDESANEQGLYGIDTVNMDSAMKVGNNSTVIDLSGLTGAEAYEKLREVLYKTNGEYTNYVHEVDEEGYKIQQLNPEHFKHNAQPIGSQMKILAINNIAPTAQVHYRKGTPAEKVISGKQLRDQYLKALDDKMKIVEREFERRLCINGTPEAKKRALSNFLIEEMAKNQKYASELREALSITMLNGEPVFEMPLDDETTQEAAEAMIYSTIRRVFYKEKMAGGPVVQAASWGQSKKLHIRFVDKNGKPMPTMDKWLEKNTGKTSSDYKTYVIENQGGVSYFEAIVPMPDQIRKFLINKETGEVDPKYFREDGSWKMGAIREVVPSEYFDAICYRIPTESKYSMMPCRIVGFSNEASGSAVFYPEELTVFSGSDFDIDKSFIELRPLAPQEGDKKGYKKSVDQKLFNLQYAALQCSDSVAELFTPGDFTDMSEQSYYLTLAISGQYTKEALDKMSSKELKIACQNLEDLDLLNPNTDIVLHRQNAEAGQIIGMAAVGVTSHAFFSLYNDGTKDGSTTIEFRHRNKYNNVDETYTIIDDSDPRANLKLLLTSDVILDNIYDIAGNLISTQISKFVGASADAAKDAALARLNITPDSFPVVETMIRLGIPRQFACAFVAQPVIRDVILEMKNQSSFGYADLDTACNTIIKAIQEINNMSDDTEIMSDERVEEIKDSIKGSNYSAGIKTIRYSELVQASFYNQSPEDQIKMIYFFKTMKQQSERIKNLDSYPRYNSTTAMRGSSYPQRYAARQKLEKLYESLSAKHPRIKLPNNIEIKKDASGRSYSKLRSMFPHVGRTIEGEDRYTKNLILSNFKTYGTLFNSVAKTLGIEEDEDALKVLHSHYKNYLLFTQGSRIAKSYSKKDVLDRTQDFPDWFFEYKESIKKNYPEIYKDKVENNSFLNSIFEVATPEDYGGWTMLATEINSLGEKEREKYITDWDCLVEDKVTAPLAINTAIYFMTRQNGVRYSRNTPIHLLPLHVKENIVGYRDTYRNADVFPVDARDFLVRFALNNAKDRKIVPYFNEITRTIDGRRTSIPQFSFFQDPEGDSFLVFDEDTYNSLLGTRISSDPYTHTDTFEPVVISVQEGDQEQLYLIDRDNIVEPTYSTEDVEEGEERDEDVATLYSVKAIPVSPLGIPGEFLEYTNIPIKEGSVFGEHNVADAAYEFNNTNDNQDSVSTEPDPVTMSPGYDLGTDQYAPEENSAVEAPENSETLDSNSSSVSVDDAIIDVVQKSNAKRGKKLTKEEAAEEVNKEGNDQNVC